MMMDEADRQSDTDEEAGDRTVEAHAFEQKDDAEQIASLSSDEEKASSSSMLGNDDMSASDDVIDDESRDYSKADAQRNARRRRRISQDILASLGVTDDEAIEAMAMIDSLMPDPMRMSSSDDIAERLEVGLSDISSSHPDLIFGSLNRKPVDTSSDRWSRESQKFKSLLDSEEGLLRAFMVNERVRSGLSAWITEHNEARGMILAELVRRQTLVESYRHLLPKYMLSIFSMVMHSGISTAKFKPGAAGISAIAQALCELSPSDIDKKELLEKSRITEEEFLPMLKEHEFAQVQSRKLLKAGSSEKESMAVKKLRLSEMHRDVQQSLQGSDDLGDANTRDLEDRSAKLSAVIALDGGIDRFGQVVFDDVDSFHSSLASFDPDYGPAIGQGSNETELSETTDAPGVSESKGQAIERSLAEVVDSSLALTPTSNGKMSDKTDDQAPLDEDESAGDLKSGPTTSVSDKTQEAGKNSGEGDHNFNIDMGGRKSEDQVGLQDTGSTVKPVEQFNTAPFEDMHIGQAHTRIEPSAGPFDKTVRSVGFAGSYILDAQVKAGTVDVFAGYEKSALPAPFNSVWERPQPSPSIRLEETGSLEPSDLIRMENPFKALTLLCRDGLSDSLGPGHLKMLPPHSSIDWYARRLGWGEQDVRKVAPFKIGADHSILATGDVSKLIEAVQGIALMHANELQDDHPQRFAVVGGHAGLDVDSLAEDLTRYWMFMLLGRHDFDFYRTILPKAFFHGAHAPDFVIKDGSVVFGDCHLLFVERSLMDVESYTEESVIVTSGDLPGRRRRVFPYKGPKT